MLRNRRESANRHHNPLDTASDQQRDQEHNLSVPRNRKTQRVNSKYPQRDDDDRGGYQPECAMVKPRTLRDQSDGSRDDHGDDVCGCEN